MNSIVNAKSNFTSFQKGRVGTEQLTTLSFNTLPGVKKFQYFSLYIDSIILHIVSPLEYAVTIFVKFIYP